MDLSIIIPAYNESHKIAGDIDSAAQFITENNLNAEIIIVDDGSSDQTFQIAQKTAKEAPSNVTIKVIRNEHTGKGFAIKTGIEQASGQYIMFADSGNCVPYSDALPAINMIKDGICDIAHGSRKLQQSNITQPQSLYRRICSKLFHWFIIYFMNMPQELSDTQCGFKIYRGDVAKKIYANCVSNGFMFDVEVILRAKKEGYKIKEFPINWTCDRDSRLSPTRNLKNVFSELLKIKKNLQNR